MKFLTSLAELQAIYGDPMATALAKVVDHLTPEYARWIGAARFCILSTVGPEGTDATPRGDDGPVVMQEGTKTLLLPDWAGNNRTDSLRNIILDDRVSLLFMVAGSTTVVRVNGRGRITVDDALRTRFQRGAKRPRSVLVVSIDEAYFQCAKALIRADLWGDAPRADIPSAGDFLSAATDGREGGAAYDAAYPARAKTRLWER